MHNFALVDMFARKSARRGMFTGVYALGVLMRGGAPAGRGRTGVVLVTAVARRDGANAGAGRAGAGRTL